MLTTEYILEVGKNTADTLKGYLNDKDGWTVVKKTDDILIESKPSAIEEFSHGYLYRAQCDYACSKETLFKYVEPQPGDCLRKKWDTDMKDVEFVKIVSPICQIVRTTTNSAAMGLISPRDFIDVGYVDRGDGYICKSAQSIQFDDTPPMPKFVRGHNYPSGIICLNIPGKAQKTSRLYTFIQTDISGSLPSSLVNSALPNAVFGLCKNLRKCLKKDGHIP